MDNPEKLATQCTQDEDKKKQKKNPQHNNFCTAHWLMKSLKIPKE